MQPLVIDDVRRFCNLAQSLDTAVNEADTEARLVLPFLRLLGWSEAPPAEIRRQVATHSLFADIHLVLNGRTLCVIEVKRRSVQLFDKGRHPRDGVLAALTKAGRDTFEQAVAYAVADGVPCAWITNGFEHLVFRVQQPWIPIESRLIMSATEAENLLAQFDDLHSLAPTALEALQLVERMPPPARGPSDVYDRLVGVCATATEQQLGWLVDDLSDDSHDRPLLKYSRSIFVPRERYEAIFEEFWRGEAPMLVFTGEAGIGKTSLLCHLALTLQRRVGSVPCIFLDAFHLGHGLQHALQQVLRHFTSSASPHDLDAAIECVEEHVLSQQPFRETLSASRLRALLAQLTDPEVRNGHASYCALLSWVRDRVDDAELADRLDWLIKAPKPRARPLLFDLGIRNRHLSDFDKFAEKLVTSASPDTIDRWQNTRAFSDTTYVDMLDAVALLHASRTTPGSDLLENASNTWLPAVSASLVEASPADLLAAPPAVRRAMVHLLSLTSAPKLLVILDAINESPHPADLRAEIVETANRFQGRLAKLVLSCRTPDLTFFESDAFRSFRFRAADRAMALDSFVTTEFVTAWNLYRIAYDIRGTPGPALTEICRQPLILRILCESFAGGAVPEDDIRLIEIFDGYWQRKVAGAADGPSRAIVLQRLADLARRYMQERDGNDGNVVPLALCEGLLENGKGIFDALISEAVLVFLSPTGAGQSGVRFMYESFHEYVLARNIREAAPLWARPDDVIAEVLGRSRQERLLRGALTYLLLWLDQQDVDVSRWLRTMYQKGLGSEAIATASKLRSRAAIVTFIRWLENQDASNDHLGMAARALAKHVDSLEPDHYGRRLAHALRDPRRARIAIPLGLTTLEGAAPRIDSDVAAYILGFDRLWCAATGAQPPLTAAERSLIRGSGRAQRVERVAAFDPSWLQKLFDRRWPAATEEALCTELAETIRSLLDPAFAPATIPGHPIGVQEWMNDLATRHRNRTPIGRAIENLMRSVSAGRKRANTHRTTVVDFVTSDARGLSFLIQGGHDSAVLFVTRLLRLTAQCRDFGRICRSSNDSAAHRLAGSVALGLYELGALLGQDDNSDSALLWLRDLSQGVDEEPATAIRQLLIVSERRKMGRAIWRELIRLASRLNSDIPDTRVGGRRHI